jgi:hypothetical protein
MFHNIPVEVGSFPCRFKKIISFVNNEITIFLDAQIAGRNADGLTNLAD